MALLYTIHKKITRCGFPHLVCYLFACVNYSAAPAFLEFLRIRTIITAPRAISAIPPTVKRIVPIPPVVGNWNPLLLGIEIVTRPFSNLAELSAFSATPSLSVSFTVSSKASLAML